MRHDPLPAATRLRKAPSGLFDTRYTAFLETVAHLRARLHRYCSRMTGSVLDGEDIMQEALFEAYRKIELLDDMQALRPWLFRIAHNRCIDFLRRRQAREQAEAAYLDDEAIVMPAEPIGAAADRAIERLVAHLPPKERACVLLKDVLDHPLEEIADLVGSTVGGVKAALSRGRTKLAVLAHQPEPPRAPQSDPELSRLLSRYVQLFNRRDWDGVRALTSADAQLRVSDCFKGPLAASPYFSKYADMAVPWRVERGELGGEAVLVVVKQLDGYWRATHPVRIRAAGGLVGAVTDYYLCPWIFALEAPAPAPAGPTAGG